MPRRGYLPMEDIAAAYRISERTARRWAAEDRWARKLNPPEYNVADAARSASRRRHPDGRQHRGPYKPRTRP